MDKSQHTAQPPTQPPVRPPVRYRDILKAVWRAFMGKASTHSAAPKPGQVSKDVLRHMGAADAAWHNFGSRARHQIAALFCSMLIVLIIWAALAEVDEVTRGMGQVVPSQRLQVVQHLEGGILVDVLVREGEHVEAGQIVGHVDNVGAASQMRDMQLRIYGHEVAIARLEGELEGRDPVFSEDLQRRNPTGVDAEKSTYEIRKRQYTEETNVLNSQIEQRQRELQESLSRKDTLKETLVIVEQREQRLRPLVERKLHSEVDFLNLQQETVRLKGEIEAIRSSISKLESAIRETEQRKELSEATRHSELVKEINARKIEMASLRETLIASIDRVTRTEVRSPVKGIVNRILINTQGGIVKPGGEIMEIIPLDDSLVVEAKIRPADIAFIHFKQKAIVKITAYDSSIYGNLEGVVDQISADTITGPPPQNETYYQVKVRTHENAIVYRGQRLPITPGMVASVDILTGKKSILNYMLKPILKAKDNALRER